jgi:uncharacterized phage protein (TIGR02220 family)
MRIYGSIQTKFWVHPEIKKLSDQAKLLGAYLLSSPHTNMLGCFRIPIGYIAEDLNWDSDLVRKALNELSAILFITYDSDWIFIGNFLKYNPIENPNQGKSIAKLFDDVPKNIVFSSQLINKLQEYSEYLQDDFINRLETLSEPFRNQDQDQDQKQEILMSGKPDVDPLFEENKNEKFGSSSSQNTNTSLKQQAIEILQFLNEKTGRAYRPVGTNINLIVARLKSGITISQCFKVIARKTRAWKGDPKMDEYLRPATLFNATKFEQYVGELVKKSGEICHEQETTLS